ncbi:Stk1 family PASTA domain-containing Ser/Thr kinase [Actinopolymorpha singaporensis]|uniref:non-specific serine/threonine protein kinase n=1 Tax=Actinopolymorpha singaporensis TaxID=117157 RepID=A0A1H1X758_9ACTN|nr:Stk1 family PASTA domain-containing Ser/Thr kinase [Actinopolymorpha singaporensis]SDT04910.1 serine/threonine protein kinase [Actinopolymorpha singaporensis]
MDVTVSDPLVGRLLDGRYRVGRRVARGGMATVYEAVDTRLDRTVAVKILHAGLVEDADFVRRFQREARSAARLSHPHVVAVFDQGADGGTPYLTMEYVAGRTLRDALYDEGPLSPERTLDLLDQVLQALAAAHEAGIVHRDVKPENVLLGRDDHGDVVKVADFGLARAVSAATNTSTHGLLMGTVSYLAPEQVTHGTADARADVYAAGIMAYEMLVGSKPHEGDSPIQVAYKHVNEDVPEPSKSVPGIPAFLDALVLRATARDPAVRPADARVFLRHVRRARTALRDGVDDPELTQDLTAFRRPAQAAAEHTLIAPLEQIRAASKAALSPSVALRPDRLDDGKPADYADVPEPHEPESPSRAWWLRVPVVGGLLAVLLLAGGLTSWFAGIGPFTRVPPVVDVAQKKLPGLAEQSGVKFVVAGQVYSENVRKGHVVRAAPAPRARTWRGGPVQVWMSLGPEVHDVPRLAGASEDRARQLLSEARLRVEEVQTAFSDTVGAGRIISTSPEAGTPLRRDGAVTLVVSKGREPVDLPPVAGMPYDAANSTLTALGLKVARTDAFSDQVPPGAVIGQQPQPGRVFRGDTVHVTVSKGPEFVPVPSVARMPVAEAQSKLAAAGFKVQVTRNPVFVGLNVVVNQTPAGNARARVGSVVVLDIV